MSEIFKTESRCPYKEDSDSKEMVLGFNGTNWEPVFWGMLNKQVWGTLRDNYAYWMSMPYPPHEDTKRDYTKPIKFYAINALSHVYDTEPTSTDKVIVTWEESVVSRGRVTYQKSTCEELFEDGSWVQISQEKRKEFDPEKPFWFVHIDRINFVYKAVPGIDNKLNLYWMEDDGRHKMTISKEIAKNSIEEGWWIIL